MFVKSLATAVFVLAAASSANAVTVVNLPGITNASTNGTNAVTINLSGGRYEVRFVEGLFTAHNRYNGTSAGCNAQGEDCTRGWETNARWYIGANDMTTGNDFAIGNFDYYRTKAQAFAASAQFVEEFIVPAGGSSVSFYIFDPLIRDNVEGVSLGIAAVPEPATWAMLIAGFGLVGFAARRRRTAIA